MSTDSKNPSALARGAVNSGIQLIKKSEGFREFAYPDPASDLARAVRARKLKVRWGFQPARDIIAALPQDLQRLDGRPWTCGYGETKGVTPDTRWSEAEASSRLSRRYVEFETAVRRACTVDPGPNQLAAMTSLAYNIGLGWEGKTKPPGAKNGFRQSSVLKAHNRGDTLAASRAFGLWNKANGKVEPGLTARRAEEAALYLKDSAEEDVDLSPQQVDPESKMSESPINRAGVVAGGTAAVATVAETARTIADVKYSTQSLGDWLVPVLLIVVIALCGFMVWERVKQRKGGWA